MSEMSAVQVALLEARAKVLAKPRALHDASAAKDEMDVLVFLVDDERLSIPLGSIVSIVRATVVTPLPRAVAPVLGVASWRGRPITVLHSAGALRPSIRCAGSSCSATDAAPSWVSSSTRWTTRAS